MDNLITIGKFGAPHGVRGEIRIIPLTDFPNRFKSLKNVIIDDSKKLTINSVKYHNQFIVIKFDEFDSKESVNTLNGKLLKVERKDVPPLSPGEFYSFDIIGLLVRDEDETILGHVVEILKTGSNDVYIVKKDNQELLIPALKSVVKSIDVKNGYMIVKLQEEMV